MAALPVLIAAETLLESGRIMRKECKSRDPDKNTANISLNRQQRKILKQHCLHMKINEIICIIGMSFLECLVNTLLYYCYSQNIYFYSYITDFLFNNSLL